MRALPVVAALCLAACDTPGPRLVELRGRTMGTAYTVKYVAAVAAGDVQSHGARVQAEIESVLKRVNRVASTYLEDSEISKFNALRSTEPVAASAELLAVVRPALDLARRTEGTYDPTIVPILRARGLTGDREVGDVSAANLARLLEHVDYRAVSAGDGTLTKRIPELEITLDSIAKGWGVDEVSKRLAASGHANHMVEIGGEVRCSGKKHDGSPWRIGVEGPPRGPERRVQQAVPLEDASMATSGDYRIYRESNGERWHHIIDARTGKNVPGAAVSVSVIAPDCLTADMLATALMLVGPDAGAKLLDSYAPVAPLRALFLLPTDDGGIEERGYRW